MKTLTLCLFASTLLFACKKSNEASTPAIDAEYAGNCRGCNVMGGGVARILYFDDKTGKRDSIMTTSLPNSFSIGDKLLIKFEYSDAPNIMVTQDKVYPKTATIISAQKR